MSKELIHEIKEQLVHVENLHSCNVSIKKDIHRHSLVIENINNTQKSLVLTLDRQNNMVRIFQRHLNLGVAKASHFLFEANLKMEDIKNIENTCNYIKTLSTVPCSFHYTRGQE